MGTGPLKRLFAKEVAVPIARKILQKGSNNFSNGTIIVDTNAGGTLSVAFQDGVLINDNKPPLENIEQPMAYEKLQADG